MQIANLILQVSFLVFISLQSLLKLCKFILDFFEISLLFVQGLHCHL